MKKMTLLCLAMCSGLFAAHRDQTERRSYEEMERQTSVRCAADETLFLQPHLEADVHELAGKVVLDAGLGSAQRILNYAEEGAQICTLEPDEEEVQDLIPYGNESFDRAISVNIGSTLPSTMYVISGDAFHAEGLGVHCNELSRVLKEGGEGTLVAPGSYEIVFTDGSSSTEAALSHIQTVLANISDATNSSEVIRHLTQLKEVNRATFVEKEGRLALVMDEKELTMGKQIWRKEGDSVFSSFYHTVEEYLVALNNAGLQCTEIKRPCFHGKVKYTLYHQNLKDDEGSLGSSYIENNPFTIYQVVKNSSLR